MCAISDAAFIRMNDVFHINLDDLDVARIRIGGQPQASAGQKASHAAHGHGHTRQVQRELEQYMEQKSLMSFVKLCRIFNIDPLGKFSFHIIMILMSKHPDRLDVIQTFIAGLHEEHRDKILLDQEAVSSFDYSENTFLTSTGDWIALFQYIRLYDLSETDQHELEADVRLQLFITSMRHAQVLSQEMDMEYIVKAFLSIYLINIPAAKILERVILQHDRNMRDNELRSLRTVNHYTDNSLHMPVQTQMDSVLLILKNTHPTAEFFATIAEVIEVCAHDHIGKHTKQRKKFSLRRHISESHVSSQVEYVHTFENWSSQQKFSVTTSICTQRLFYWTQAQCIPIPADVYLKFFDSALLEKVVQGTLHQIDIAAVLLVIKSLRVYHNNIKSLLDFRTQCTAGVNAATRNNLTRALVLQLYVATWQHESIREQCWQSIIGAYNYTISSSCDTFRKRNTYEYEAVLQSLVKCLIA
jgi:hypothetical protein